MKSQMEMRLECLKLATNMGTSKNILAKDVIPTAMEYYRWVDGSETEPSQESIKTLRNRFR